VFNENVGQEGVMSWLKDAIDSFITGYNVSLLAYGQSGAGKSYTMGTSGPNEQNDPWQMGKFVIITALISQVLSLVRRERYSLN
jgi:Kinesin motor domain